MKNLRLWRISLGTCGPTDCGLILTNPDSGESVQFGIESTGWHVLSVYWNLQEQTGVLPDALGSVLWRHQEEFNQ